MELLKILASVYRSAKKYPEALSTIDRGLKIDPMDAELYFVIGVIYDESGADDKGYSGHAKGAGD